MVRIGNNEKSEVGKSKGSFPRCTQVPLTNFFESQELVVILI